MKCAECSDRWKCGAGYDLRKKRRGCEKAKKPAKRSNADRIRYMTDEELAEWIAYRQGCFERQDKRCSKYGTCRDCWLEWLREEATDDI